MDAREQLIIVKGQDKTDSIASCRFYGNKCHIVYNNSSQIYSYDSCKVQTIKLKRIIDPQSVVFKYRGIVIKNIDQIRDYGDFYRIERDGIKELSCRRDAVKISKNCLADKQNKKLFNYFKSTAEAVSIKTEDGVNILSRQYDKVEGIEDETVLSKYFNSNIPIEKRTSPSFLVFPFGLNASQKKAVENAFSSQISIIQGPPGTGKTQTILNIVANAVQNGKTVAVVSNNNSALENVAIKLEKIGLGFLVAFLGNLNNKQNFLAKQTGRYPNMCSWILSNEERKFAKKNVIELSKELDKGLELKNRGAEINQELLTLEVEKAYFEDYYARRKKVNFKSNKLSRLSSDKILSLWIECENAHGQKINFFKKILIAFRFGGEAVALFRCDLKEVIPFVQRLYYISKYDELQREKTEIESKLKDYQFETKLQEMKQVSLRLFKAKLAERYDWMKERKRFNFADFRKESKEFNQEYPIILSTTYSIKGTLSVDYIYDYLIVDEASQVDLATSVLAFSCARNIIIVGDQKQLPNVLTAEEIKVSDDIWDRYDLDENYHFSTHSMLASAEKIWKTAPSSLLREHYRCHPKIAGFFNKKFYNDKLIVMTKDRGEDALTMYRTVSGNHARGRMNQRQIDVIQKELLPELEKRGFKNIGIITPYRDQVKAMQKQLGTNYEIATVHKFQGREKDAIILASVDNVIGDFVDDPKLLNVAVSRAVNSLSIVISNDKENEKTNYGDLAKYIEYNNFQIIDSKVFSIFDLLYKDYFQRRNEYLKKHKRISEYDSENLIYSIVEKILAQEEFSNIDCAVHFSLSMLIRDFSLLTNEEEIYASNPLTHLDFVLFNKMNRKPILGIEVDGTRYHKEGSRQAERDGLKNGIMEKYEIPLLRIRTDESDIENRIITKLKTAM